MCLTQMALSHWKVTLQSIHNHWLIHSTVVNSTTGQYGNFSYSESDGGQVNRSYNGSKDIEVEACDLIDSVIEDLKAEALK